MYPVTINTACTDVQQEQEQVTSPVAEISIETLKEAQEKHPVNGKV